MRPVITRTLVISMEKLFKPAVCDLKLSYILNFFMLLLAIMCYVNTRYDMGKIEPVVAKPHSPDNKALAK